ncbi:MAG TPA: DUF2147 domain-containing protein [Burkholderiaceae bacterium]|nr:DUF2147 domain-containing protein [Burkholderiaceae bacterium]
MRPRPLLPALLLAAVATSASSEGSEDAKGLWLSAEGDAVLRFEACADQPAALCGAIVWDKDAGKPNDTCGVQVARLERHAEGAWRDGWVFDPRDGKKYRGILRVKGGDLFIRAYVGAEILGQTEQLKRVAKLPAAPVCKS